MTAEEKGRRKADEKTPGAVRSDYKIQEQDHHMVPKPPSKRTGNNLRPKIDTLCPAEYFNFFGWFT
jgi:hypothetical protein